MSEWSTSDLARIVARSEPGSELLDVTLLNPDAGEGAATSKSVGYGEPLKIRVRTRGEERIFVLHTAGANPFGHDRRADRASAMLLAYDTFSSIPGHVPAIDVGAITRDGKALISLADTSEFYLLTRWAEGHVYADELRALSERGAPSERDREHCRSLARYLAALHREPLEGAVAYQRAARDLVGSGEGIFGIIDGYPDGVPEASSARLQRIEARCVAWRWRLRARASRLRRTHGDFHPFNIVFDDSGVLTLLDTSRGSLGDPADDVACIAINYVFFALDRPGAWASAFQPLWYEFWQSYEAEANDPELRACVAPFLAWRGLVLANPVWYAQVSPDARDRLLSFVERTLDAEQFEPELAEGVFA
ncbi:MAG TPA: phosphotransferase [Polyangiaceae bacterium]